MELRTTRWVSSRVCDPFRCFDEDIRSRTSNAIRPRHLRSSFTVVNGGFTKRAKYMSSQPSTETCSGTRIPISRKALIAPIAVRSLMQIRAVGGGALVDSLQTAARPPSKV